VIKLDVLSCFLAVTFLFYTTHTIPILFYAAYPLLLHHNLQYQQYHDQPPYCTPRLSDTTAILRAEATRQQPAERLFHQILTPTNSTLAPHPIVIMVQFKPTTTGGRTEREKHRSNTYWMLGSLSDRSAREMRQELENRGYQCRKSASKVVLADSLGRLERGLLCYEKCDAVELRRFCKSRGVSSGATTVSRLARRLEDADDHTSFPRFFELPPEIRLAIYEYHFNDYDPMTHKHRQPPLTLASSRLRLEALPAFYKCVKFEWHFKWHFKYGFHYREEELPFSEDSCDLLSMPAASLSQMKNFGVH
jgi:hypothetical protein